MYYLYLDDLCLPVTPEEITMKWKDQNRTANLVNGEEIEIAEIPGLEQISFTALFPWTRYPFARYPDGFELPEFYLQKLRDLKKNKTPFHLLFTCVSPGGRYLSDLNRLVALETCTVRYSAENGMDVTADITLREYRPYHTLILTDWSNGEAVVQQEQRLSAQAPAAKTYTVQAGDTLWNICKKQLGDGSKCWEIAEKNGLKNPNLIYAGQVISLG